MKKVRHVIADRSPENQVHIKEMAGDLSNPIEKATRKQIFEMSAKKVKSINDPFSEETLAEIVTEAVLWARNNDSKG